MRRKRRCGTALAAVLSLLFACARFAADAQPAADTPPAVPASPAPALPAAGAVPATITLDITGVKPADPAFLDAQIRDGLDRAIRPTLRPGASIRYGPFVPWPLLALAPGTRAAAYVTVTIAGDTTSMPVTGITTVVLNSAPLPPAPATVLFLSDDPEYLQSEGLVFRGDVATERAARLYYYHSDIGVPRDLDIALTSTVAARVHLIASKGGPDLDVMAVGHAVSRDVLQYEADNAGIIVDVVPGKPFIVRHALILQGELAAGAVDLRVLSGGPIAVSVVSTAAGGRPETYLAGPRVAFDGHRRHGTFDLSGYGDVPASYTVGGPPIGIQYGGKIPTARNIDPSDDGRNYGDYGVVRRIAITLVNPDDAPHLVYVYEKPLGGPVRSSFFVDGRLREMGCVRVRQPYWVTTYQLQPHTTGVSTTVTMTDGGSYYPLEYGVTDEQPLLTTPPVGAPDGCSPIVRPFPDGPAANGAPLPLRGAGFGS